jgi:dihydroflavonol-4-reductase
VEDVAKSMILLMDSDISDERFIINAENWTYRDLFSEIAENLGKNPPKIALKPWMIYLAYLGTRLSSIFTGKKHGLTKETASSAFKKRNFSNEKIKKTLNLEFKSIKEVIRETCHHFQTQ